MVASIFEFLNQEPHSRLGKPVALKLKAACKGVKREKKSPCPSKKQEHEPPSLAYIDPYKYECSYEIH
ncbi:hypothetical protein POPTR_017G071333v4 [Populus trichocarpa]|uniref:Uncharacterized protein n=1 Tax=Populus trichocarpa TaxID=3694 RepID=A0A2K1X4C7_POPTR|nr:hypothetical protein POPTR_017G071333v4 [Populus trichocarpa]